MPLLYVSLFSTAGKFRRRAYTLIEMLATVAVLIIVLGLMVSLARYVRERAAVAMTKDVLRRLDQLMAEYAQHHEGQPPHVVAFPPVATKIAPGAAATLPSDPSSSDPRALMDAALINNHDFVSALKAETGLTGGALADMPLSMYDEVILRDAWGSPIVFMPSKHPWVGTAPQDRFFFFSAGPDRLYLTQDDNLYSYEDVATR